MTTESKTGFFNQSQAIQIILFFGLVSLFGDIVYEGARSVNGPYLEMLGANALMVGIIAGIGEFLGYGIRLVSGYLSDKTKAYWIFTISGYILLISVPMIALTGFWQMVAVFILIERLGKALRAPSKSTIMSFATKEVGHGFGFGLHEAMDQIGAVSGPLIFTLIFFLFGNQLRSYKIGYSVLWVPVILTIMFVLLAMFRFPHRAIEELKLKENAPSRLTPSFWIYTVFSFFTTLGFVTFAVLAFHFKKTGVLSDLQIPLFYAIAMGLDAAVALIIGKMYDKKGLSTLIWIPVFSIPLAFLAFSTNWVMVLGGVLLWGVVMGMQETIMQAAIADITSMKKRGTGYGIFNTVYGLAFLAGSSLIGLFYETNIRLVIGFCLICQLISVPLYIILMMRIRKDGIGVEK